MSARRDDEQGRLRAGIEAAYGAYDEHPLDEADEWGDLESFHAASDVPEPADTPPD